MIIRTHHMRYLHYLMNIFAIIGTGITMVSCSLFRERNVQDVIDELPTYHDETPIEWGDYLGDRECLRTIKTIGQLKDAIKNREVVVNQEKTGENDTKYLAIAPQIRGYFHDPKKGRARLLSRLAALDVFLKAGANPQYMYAFEAVPEEEYALFIKYGLDARRPIRSENGYEYPLTNRFTFLTLPIMKWLLENGADPNQKELHRWDYDDGMTPWSYIHSNPERYMHPFLLHSYGNAIKVERTPKYMKAAEKMLIEHGAKP